MAGTAEFYAHSRNESGERHDLVTHLRGVAELASSFAGEFAAQDAAYFLGLWHDLGKFNPAFRQYLFTCESNPGVKSRGPDHKLAGACLAMQHLAPLAMLVQGHHGGIRSRTESTDWVRQGDSEPVVADALAWARECIPDLEPQTSLAPPEHTRHSRVGAELWLRMLFSALVDADYLDTERHFSQNRTAHRGSGPGLFEFWERFQANQRQLINNADANSVNQVRSYVYQSCVAAAELPQGVFRLTVPTGGGKTRSAMAFALRHAVKLGYERVIVALPFISITQQTAQVYQEILQIPGKDENVVLEHHSMVAADEGDDFHQGPVWNRLASENWDAPVVVTTTVQLFQSLFSNRTSHTRKLHRLARSVIILDEAQALPPALLTPILDVLRDLCEHYGTTLVLSTATQPAFEAIKGFADLPATEIVHDSARHFQTLSRVSYEWCVDPPLSWLEVADFMREEQQALCVLNTKRHSLVVLEALEDPDALYLSTLLCGEHRRQVIEEVKRRLKARDACRLVSTQVIEAGVDVDFPLVLRALGPLDAIIQSAGRCNREGRLDQGRVIVFRPETGGIPQGSYRTGADITEAMLRAGPVDLDDPQITKAYFRRLFNSVETDRENIQSLRANLDYPEVADKFRMIEPTESVVISSFGTPDQRRRTSHALRQLRKGVPQARHILRRLQPFIVSVYQRQLRSLLQSGLVEEIMPGLYEWRGAYDSVRGIGGVTSLDPDQLIA